MVVCVPGKLDASPAFQHGRLISLCDGECSCLVFRGSDVRVVALTVFLTLAARW